MAQVLAFIITGVVVGFAAGVIALLCKLDTMSCHIRALESRMDTKMDRYFINATLQAQEKGLQDTIHRVAALAAHFGLVVKVEYMTGAKTSIRKMTAKEKKDATLQIPRG